MSTKLGRCLAPGYEARIEAETLKMKGEIEAKKIENALGRKLKERLRLNEPMAKHTTIGVGGRARFFALPVSTREIEFLVRFTSANCIDCLVIGRGSNLLVRDGGFGGLVIKIAGNFSRIRVHAKTVAAQAGASISLLARKMVALGRGGLEFAVGIPGSVGGAVRMNAGAFGGEIADIITRVRCIDSQGRTRKIDVTHEDFDYRKSFVGKSTVVISASFRCPPRRVDDDLLERSLRRRSSQPLEHRSFGSTFVNPPGEHAGHLIEQCGLKGLRIGGAMVSEKHANFILNVGSNTKARDVEALISRIKKEVQEKIGINLKPEVVIVGDK